jgi:hypothetical protein
VLFIIPGNLLIKHSGIYFKLKKAIAKIGIKGGIAKYLADV